MQNLVGKLNSMFGGNEEGIISVHRGFSVEAPYIKEAREAALEKMKQWGRDHILKGGHFSLHNRTLNSQSVDVQWQ